MLKGIQKSMDIPTYHMLPSFATLRDYGNTSCSTTVCGKEGGGGGGGGEGSGRLREGQHHAECVLMQG